ncbi:MAG: FkbM family methyltransferase [Acidobacteria bacterium]|nr:FkbM family methyltransferase [Acidobacteriota bacterium]
MTLKETQLPGIGTITCLRPDQVAELHEQVEHYFQHGIDVWPGCTVVDVGANLGLFSLTVLQRCHGDATSYMFEPVPSIFAALEQNARRHGRTRLHPVCCGLSSRAGNVQFAYRPNMPSLSTAYVDDEAELEEQVKQAILRNLGVTHWRVRWIGWVPAFLRRRILDRAVAQMFATELVECRLRTLSEVIAEFGIERIDLLKIDAEKSELDVLEGIADADWPKIQQVVMEVHDIDGRLVRIRKLLGAHGIGPVVTAQEPALRGSNVHDLFARRVTAPDQASVTAPPSVQLPAG